MSDEEIEMFLGGMSIVGFIVFFILKEKELILIQNNEDNNDNVTLNLFQGLYFSLFSYTFSYNTAFKTSFFKNRIK